MSDPSKLSLEKTERKSGFSRVPAEIAAYLRRLWQNIKSTPFKVDARMDPTLPPSLSPEEESAALRAEIYRLRQENRTLEEQTKESRERRRLEEERARENQRLREEARKLRREQKRLDYEVKHGKPPMSAEDKSCLGCLLTPIVLIAGLLILPGLCEFLHCLWFALTQM